MPSPVLETGDKAASPPLQEAQGLEANKPQLSTLVAASSNPLDWRYPGRLPEEVMPGRAMDTDVPPRVVSRGSIKLPTPVGGLWMLEPLGLAKGKVFFLLRAALSGSGGENKVFNASTGVIPWDVRPESSVFLVNSADSPCNLLRP